MWIYSKDENKFIKEVLKEGEPAGSEAYTVEEFEQYVNALEKMFDGFFSLVDEFEKEVSMIIGLDPELTTLEDIKKVVANLKQGLPEYSGIDENKIRKDSN